MGRQEINIYFGVWDSNPYRSLTNTLGPAAIKSSVLSLATYFTILRSVIKYHHEEINVYHIEMTMYEILE